LQQIAVAGSAANGAEHQLHYARFAAAVFAFLSVLALRLLTTLPLGEAGTLLAFNTITGHLVPSIYWLIDTAPGQYHYLKCDTQAATAPDCKRVSNITYVEYTHHMI
jgi:hypothetical protein